MKKILTFGLAYIILIKTIAAGAARDVDVETAVNREGV